jgi:ribosomal protein S18 acetylase RimI-like enzyme
VSKESLQEDMAISLLLVVCFVCVLLEAHAFLPKLLKTIGKNTMTNIPKTAPLLSTTSKKIVNIPNDIIGSATVNAKRATTTTTIKSVDVVDKYDHLDMSLAEAYEEILREHKEKQQGDNIFVRKTTFNEVASVVSLRVNVFYPELKAIPQFHKRIYEKLSNRIKHKGSTCFVAYENEHQSREANKSIGAGIIGTVEVSCQDFLGTCMENIGSLDKCYVADLAVVPSYRRKGLATQLLKRVEQFCNNNGYDEVYLHVEKDNDAAKNLYLKNGYSEVSTLYPWAIEFTESHLQKNADGYVFLWKQLGESDVEGVIEESFALDRLEAGAEEMLLSREAREENQRFNLRHRDQRSLISPYDTFD